MIDMSGTVRNAGTVRIVLMRLMDTKRLAGRRRLTLVCRLVTALAMGLSTPAMVLAQTAPVAPPDAKPSPATPTTGSPASKPAAPRTRIELPPAERQAIEGGKSENRPTTPTRSELLPNADDATTTIIDEPANVIEQIRTSNRITEIRVTPAMTGRTYIMTNREGRQPTTATDTTSGLSVPKFFTFEFGRQADRPAAALPPPPSSTSR
jgi:hypothetical protein